jgi:hypothetical protein
MRARSASKSFDAKRPGYDKKRYEKKEKDEKVLGLE